MFITSWKDTKTVNFLSTIKVATCEKFVNEGQNNHIHVITPTITLMYNKYMGGTDRFDQKISYYFPEIRSIKWYKRVFIQFIYIALVNSHILYKMKFNLNESDINFTLEEFIDSVTNSLLGNQVIPNEQVIDNHYHRRSTLAADNQRISQNHEPYKLEPIRSNEDTHTKYQYRRCVVCSIQDKESKTPYICKICGVGLCYDAGHQECCWYIFHSNEYTKLYEANNKRAKK